MRYPAVFKVIILVAIPMYLSPAFARGFFEQVLKDLNGKQSIQIDRLHENLGKPLDRVVAPATAADVKAVSNDLSKKTEDDLLYLSFSLTPCSEIACRNVPTEIVKQLINSMMEKNRAVTDLEVRKYQAWAAVISASISFLSLILSIISLVRSRQTSIKAKPSNVFERTLTKETAQNS